MIVLPFIRKNRNSNRKVDVHQMRLRNGPQKPSNTLTLTEWRKEIVFQISSEATIAAWSTVILCWWVYVLRGRKKTAQNKVVMEWRTRLDTERLIWLEFYIFFLWMEEFVFCYYARLHRWMVCSYSSPWLYDLVLFIAFHTRSVYFFVRYNVITWLYDLI